MNNAILTAGEAAAILRISKSMMYALMRNNTVPHISIGNRQVIPASQLYEWIEKSVVGGKQ